MAVLVLARIVLVLCVFLLVERACHSSVAGGVGVLVYAANPEFYSLGAQYGYQTLALTFAVAAVYLIFVSIDECPPKRGKLFALAVVSIAGMVVSHHVTAWLTVGFLVVWAAGLRFVIDPSRPPVAAARRKRHCQYRWPRCSLPELSSSGCGSRSSAQSHRRVHRPDRPGRL